MSTSENLRICYLCILLPNKNEIILVINLHFFVSTKRCFEEKQNKNKKIYKSSGQNNCVFSSVSK